MLDFDMLSEESKIFFKTFEGRGISRDIILRALDLCDTALLTNIVCLLLHRYWPDQQFDVLPPGERIADIDAIDFLGVNKGRIRVHAGYLMPYHAISSQSSSLVDFCRILRSRTDWTAATFLDAIIHSNLNEYLLRKRQVFQCVTVQQQRDIVFAYILSMTFVVPSVDDIDYFHPQYHTPRHGVETSVMPRYDPEDSDIFGGIYDPLQEHPYEQMCFWFMPHLSHLEGFLQAIESRPDKYAELVLHIYGVLISAAFKGLSPTLLWAFTNYQLPNPTPIMYRGAVIYDYDGALRLGFTPNKHLTRYLYEFHDVFIAHHKYDPYTRQHTRDVADLQKTARDLQVQITKAKAALTTIHDTSKKDEMIEHMTSLYQQIHDIQLQTEYHHNCIASYRYQAQQTAEFAQGVLAFLNPITWPTELSYIRYLYYRVYIGQESPFPTSFEFDPANPLASIEQRLGQWNDEIIEYELNSFDLKAVLSRVLMSFAANNLTNAFDKCVRYVLKLFPKQFKVIRDIIDDSSSMAILSSIPVVHPSTIIHLLSKHNLKASTNSKKSDKNNLCLSLCYAVLESAHTMSLYAPSSQCLSQLGAHIAPQSAACIPHPTTTTNDNHDHQSQPVNDDKSPSSIDGLTTVTSQAPSVQPSAPPTHTPLPSILPGVDVYRIASPTYQPMFVKRADYEKTRQFNHGEPPQPQPTFLEGSSYVEVSQDYHQSLQRKQLESHLSLSPTPYYANLIHICNFDIALQKFEAVVTYLKSKPTLYKPSITPSNFGVLLELSSLGFYSQSVPYNPQLLQMIFDALVTRQAWDEYLTAFPPEQVSNLLVKHFADYHIKYWGYSVNLLFANLSAIDHCYHHYIPLPKLPAHTTSFQHAEDINDRRDALQSLIGPNCYSFPSITSIADIPEFDDNMVFCPVARDPRRNESFIKDFHQSIFTILQYYLTPANVARVLNAAEQATLLVYLGSLRDEKIFTYASQHGWVPSFAIFDELFISYDHASHSSDFTINIEEIMFNYYIEAYQDHFTSMKELVEWIIENPQHANTIVLNPQPTDVSASAADAVNGRDNHNNNNPQGGAADANGNGQPPQPQQQQQPPPPPHPQPPQQESAFFDIGLPPLEPITPVKLLQHLYMLSKKVLPHHPMIEQILAYYSLPSPLPPPPHVTRNKVTVTPATPANSESDSTHTVGGNHSPSGDTRHGTDTSKHETDLDTNQQQQQHPPNTTTTTIVTLDAMSADVSKALTPSQDAIVEYVKTTAFMYPAHGFLPPDVFRRGALDTIHSHQIGMYFDYANDYLVGYGENRQTIENKTYNIFMFPCRQDFVPAALLGGPGVAPQQGQDQQPRPLPPPPPPQNNAAADPAPNGNVNAAPIPAVNNPPPPPAAVENANANLPVAAAAAGDPADAVQPVEDQQQQQQPPPAAQAQAAPVQQPAEAQPLVPQTLVPNNIGVTGLTYNVMDYDDSDPYSLLHRSEEWLASPQSFDLFLFLQNKYLANPDRFPRVTMPSREYVSEVIDMNINMKAMAADEVVYRYYWKQRALNQIIHRQYQINPQQPHVFIHQDIYPLFINPLDRQTASTLIQRPKDLQRYAFEVMTSQYLKLPYEKQSYFYRILFYLASLSFTPFYLLYPHPDEFTSITTMVNIAMVYGMLPLLHMVDYFTMNCPFDITDVLTTLNTYPPRAALIFKYFQYETLLYTMTRLNHRTSNRLPFLTRETMLAHNAPMNKLYTRYQENYKKNDYHAIAEQVFYSPTLGQKDFQPCVIDISDDLKRLYIIFAFLLLDCQRQVLIGTDDGYDRTAFHTHTDPQNPTEPRQYNGALSSYEPYAVIFNLIHDIPRVFVYSFLISAPTSTASVISSAYDQFLYHYANELHDPQNNQFSSALYYHKNAPRFSKHYVHCLMMFEWYDIDVLTLKDCYDTPYLHYVMKILHHHSRYLSNSVDIDVFFYMYRRILQRQLRKDLLPYSYDNAEQDVMQYIKDKRKWLNLQYRIQYQEKKMQEYLIKRYVFEEQRHLAAASETSTESLPAVSVAPVDSNRNSHHNEDDDDDETPFDGTDPGDHIPAEDDPETMLSEEFHRIQMLVDPEERSQSLVVSEKLQIYLDKLYEYLQKHSFESMHDKFGQTTLMIGGGFRFRFTKLFNIYNYHLAPSSTLTAKDRFGRSLLHHFCGNVSSRDEIRRLAPHYKTFHEEHEMEPSVNSFNNCYSHLSLTAPFGPDTPCYSTATAMYDQYDINPADHPDYYMPIRGLVKVKHIELDKQALNMDIYMNNDLVLLLKMIHLSMTYRINAKNQRYTDLYSPNPLLMSRGLMASDRQGVFDTVAQCAFQPDYFLSFDF